MENVGFSKTKKIKEDTCIFCVFVKFFRLAAGIFHHFSYYAWYHVYLDHNKKVQESQKKAERLKRQLNLLEKEKMDKTIF